MGKKKKLDMDKDFEEIRLRALANTEKEMKRDPEFRKEVEAERELNRKRLSDSEGNPLPTYRINGSGLDDFLSGKPNTLQRKFENEFDDISDEEADKIKREADIDDKPLTARRKKTFRPDVKRKFAENGFMGMINQKTLFTVGEQSKREFVSVKPKNDFNFFSSPKKSKKGKKNNNIFDVGGF